MSLTRRDLEAILPGVATWLTERTSARCTLMEPRVAADSATRYVASYLRVERIAVLTATACAPLANALYSGVSTPTRAMRPSRSA